MSRNRPHLSDLLLASPAGVAAAARLLPELPPDALGNRLMLLSAYVLLYTLATAPWVYLVRLFVGLAVRSPPRWLRRVPLLVGLSGPVFLSGVAGQRLVQDRAADRSAPLSETQAPSPMCQVTLVAMDGADPEQVAQGIEAGRLPNFARLQREGVSSPLRTISPHSPLVWTAVASGRSPEDHGVQSYVSVYLRDRAIALPQLQEWDHLGNALYDRFDLRDTGAISSNARQVPALWELLTQLQRPSLIIGWWATYPAEPILGVMVSNHAIPWNGFQPEHLEHLRQGDHLVSPAELQAPVVERVAQQVEALGGQGMLRDAFSPEGAEFFWLRDTLALDQLERLSEPEMVLRSAYLQGIDTASHAYTHEVFGRNVNELRQPQVSEAQRLALWDSLVLESYRRMDAQLGALLDARAADECLVVVSDHGWSYDGTSHWRLPDGVFMGVGPAFKVGQPAGEPIVYDVFPTLAMLLGVPLSEELPGRVMTGAMRGVEGRELGVLASYGRRGRRLPVTVTDEDGGHLERLRALGYVE